MGPRGAAYAEECRLAAHDTLRRVYEHVDAREVAEVQDIQHTSYIYISAGK